MTKLNETTDDDGVIKDGQTVRVRMNMMDSALDTVQRAIIAAQSVADTSSTAGYRPGSLPLTDTDRASREERYSRRDQKLRDAYKNAPPLEPSQAKTAIVPATSAERYAARDARLENAWKSA